MINRLILWLSLAGMILALHLWVQKARGFDQGCLGMSKPVFVSEGGCAEVSDLPASHLLGVSNAAWGYSFYFGLAVLSFAKLFTRPMWARRLHQVGEIAVAGALLYSGYLVFQMGFVAHAWCVLCLTSAALVTTLAVLHAVLRGRGGFQPIGEQARATELALATGGLFVASGLLVAVLLFVNRIGTRPLDQGNTAKEIERLVGESLPVYIDAQKLQEMRACHIDWNAPTLPPGKFVRDGTPGFGAKDGIRVVLFYDPNCAHCREHFTKAFSPLLEKFGDRARFFVLPRMLWDYSSNQVAALRLAESTDKYLEVWRGMFAAQKEKEGMSVPEIAALFTRLGLDASNLEARLGALQGELQAQRDLARESGIDAVPAVFINGRRVWRANMTPDCIGILIDRRIAAESTPANRGSRR